MGHVVADRVKEQSSTTGTGSFTLTGAVSGFKAFSAVLTSNGDTTWYCAVNGSEWEVGLGTRSSSSVLARTLILASSNSDAAVSFTAGPMIFATLPAAAIKGLAVAVTQDTLPTNPNAADDEFESAALDTGGTRRASATAWATLNPTGVTFSQAEGALMMSAPSNGGTEGLKAAEQVIPVGTWKFRTKLWGTWESYNVNASIGLLLRNTSNSKVVVLARQRFSSSPNDFVAVFKFNSPTSFNSAYLSATDASTLSLGQAWAPGYFEIEWDATNYILRMSPSGLTGSFRTLATFTPADFLGTADRIGICIAPVSQAVTAHAEWFRRVA